MKSPRFLTGFFAGIAAARLGAAEDLASSNALPALLPPRAALPPTFWEQYGWWVIPAAILLLIIAAVLAFVLWRSQTQAVAVPAVEARRKLEPLRQHPESGAMLSLVSQVLRRYFAASFKLPPEEMNTAECCRAIAGHPQMGTELSAALAEFLRACDQRKFAPAAAAGSVPPLDAVSGALKLIEQAEERRALVQAPAAVPARD